VGEEMGEREWRNEGIKEGREEGWREHRAGQSEYRVVTVIVLKGMRLPPSI
jgi:hypothetical protein